MASPGPRVAVVGSGVAGAATAFALAAGGAEVVVVDEAVLPGRRPRPARGSSSPGRPAPTGPTTTCTPPARPTTRR